jgi:hypothetical protein
VHGAVLRGVPHRVDQQVADHPGQFAFAGHDDRPAAVRGDQLDPAAGGQWRHAGDGVGDDLPQRHGGGDQPQRAGVDPGQLEQVVDELGHPVGLDPDPPVVLLDGGRIVDDAVFEGLGHRPQPGQGGAQIVRHPGDEFAPAGLQAPFTVPGRLRPDRGGGQPATEDRPDGQADHRGRAHRDQHDAQVVPGQEHGPGDRGHTRDHGQDRDGEQHHDVQQDRAAAHQPQCPGAGQPDDTAGQQGIQPDEQHVLHRAAPSSGSYR